jgi:hypothetical protein
LGIKTLNFYDYLFLERDKAYGHISQLGSWQVGWGLGGAEGRLLKKPTDKEKAAMRPCY